MTITLATLPQASAQEVFDQVATHLLKQMKKSKTQTDNSDRCAYRNPEGLKCAAGCLISDQEFLDLVLPEDMATSAWGALVGWEIAPDNHFDLIADLQYVHDSNEPEAWRKMLEHVACQHNLEFKPQEAAQ